MRRILGFTFFLTVLLSLKPTCCSALSDIDSLTLSLARAREDTVKIRLLNSLANAYSEHDMNISLDYITEMLVLTEKLPEKQRGSIYANSAVVYLHCNVYDKALELLLKALRIFEKTGKRQSIAVIKNSMGGVYLRLSKPELALKYFKEGLQETEQLIQEGDSSMLQNLHVYYNNIGLIYETQAGNEALAGTYMEKAIEHVAPDNYMDLGQYYNNLALHYYNSGRTEKAFHCAEKSMDYRKKLDNEYGIARSNYTLGYLYYKEKDLKKAKIYLEKARETAQKINSSLILENVYNLLVQIYEAENNYKAANDFLKKQTLLQNSLVNDTILARTTALRLEYDFDKRTALQRAEIQKTELKLKLTLYIAALVFIVLALLFFLFRSRNKRIQLEKETLEKDLETRNKELTTNVMYLMRNTDLIRTVTERLIKLKPRLKSENSDVIKEIILDLESLMKDDLWNEFETHFNRVHLYFYKKLKEICPDLSPSELKLCAFLRLNMSSKEISSISGITVKSVEVMRGRIRKKLNITNTDTNLINFLSEF